MTSDNAMTGKPGTEIVFDSSSGISEEEQREILDDINGIAEKNRRSLSAAVPAGRITAKKNGGLFPLAVNIIALIFLAGGFFLLSSIHGREDLRLREGTKVFNSAERALINEIRKETSLRIEEKEKEINQVISKMEEVDLLLSELHSSNIELTAEQRAAEGNLKSLQDEYRQSLGLLMDDRSRILENARTREAALYAQLEERYREFTQISEQKDAAIGELERLGADQEKAAAIETQLGAYIAAAGQQIENNEFDEALHILDAMRQFLNTPAFQGLRSVQARKNFHTRSIAIMETLIAQAQKNQAGAASTVLVPGAEAEKKAEELMAENARLAETISGLNRTLAAVNSQGSGTAQRLAELEESSAALRSINAALDAVASEHEKLISELESQNTELTSTVAARDNEIKELEAQGSAREERIESLNTELTSLRQAIRALSQ